MINRSTRAAMALTLTLAACGGGDSNETPETAPEVTINRFPTESFTVTDCNDDPFGETSFIDYRPDLVDEEGPRSIIGFAVEYTEEGNPIIDAGVAIRGLGNNRYEISTTDNESSTTEIDLGDGPFTLDIEYTEDFSGRFLARLIDDEEYPDSRQLAEFTLGCLPE